MGYNLSEGDMRKTFSLFAPDGNLAKSDFVTAFRACGPRPTNAEVNNIASGVGDLDTESFLAKVRSEGNIGPSPEELLAALQAFDGNDSGFLNKRELGNLLQTLGTEPMDADEVQRLWKWAPLNAGGDLMINEWHKAMTNPVPTLIPDIKELQAECGISIDED